MHLAVEPRAGLRRAGPGPAAASRPASSVRVRAAGRYGDDYEQQGEPRRDRWGSTPRREYGEDTRQDRGGGRAYGDRGRRGYGSGGDSSSGDGSYGQLRSGYSERRSGYGERDGGGYREGGRGGERNGSYRPGGRGGRGPRGGLPGGDDRPPRVLSPEAEAINASIRTAKGWRELQRVLEGSDGGGAGLDAFQLVAMLGRAAVLPRPGPSEADDLADFQGFVAALYGWLLARVDSARPTQVARALGLVARLGLYNAELVGTLVARAERELHNFRDADVAALVEAMASLGVAPSPGFAEQLLRRTQGRLSTMEPATLVALLGALPRIGVTPTPEWLAACGEGAVAGVKVLGAADFSALLVGLATAGWRPAGPQQLAPLVDRCFPLLQFELRVDGGGGRGRGRTSLQQEQGSAAAGASGQQEQGQEQGQVQQRRQQQFGAQRQSGRPQYMAPQYVAPQVAIDWLVNVAWALAQMLSGTGAQLPPQWGTLVFDRLQFVRRFMRPAELASLLSSCAYLGVRPTDERLASLLQDLANMYSDASGDDLANVAMALAQFQYRPTERFLDDFLITLSRKLPATSAAGLSTVVSALPAISRGVRLNEVVAGARARYDAIAAAEAAAAAATDAAQGYGLDQAAPEPAAVTA